MLNATSWTWLVGTVWFMAVLVVLASSMAIDATWSTTTLLLVMCAVPMGVALLMGFGAPPPATREMLYSMGGPGGRG